MWGVATHVKLQHLRVTLNEAGYSGVFARSQTALPAGGGYGWCGLEDASTSEGLNQLHFWAIAPFTR